jgi:hypothetical protein
MEFVFHELQLKRFTVKGLDPLQVAHRMLEDYTRALYIDMNLGDHGRLMKKAQEIAAEFNLRVEKTAGSLDLLKDTLNHALKRLRHPEG